MKTEHAGVVEAALPRGLYRVGLESGEKVTASIGGAARQTTVRVIPGDRVMIERSELDPTRGKIIRRL
ncbi:MAG TPA: translation initiation factor IF-1 [Polyangiales bacterium]|nr:translation initiation factor IF-1 [Polyangiales bacterium]